MAHPETGSWSSAKIREEYFNYFRSKQHTFVPSSSTIPYEDPTLLFANAGMNQASWLNRLNKSLAHIFATVQSNFLGHS